MKSNRLLLFGTVSAATAATAAILISVTSCSSVNTARDASFARTIQLKDGDRTPASEPRVYWTKSEKQLFVGQGGLHTSFGADIQQIKEWTETIPYQDTCYRDGFTEENGTCEGYRCSSSGSGKSEAWDAFYSAPKSRKANALADAIKGVGESTAEKLIAADYFHRKPRSWEDFSNEINSAANRGVIGKDISYQVLVKYKAENAANLGYEGSSCSTYQYSCTVYTPGLIPYACTKYKDQIYTRVIDSMRRTVSIDVSNPSLQSFETDTATVSVGRDLNDVSAEIGPYNRYNVDVDNRNDTAHIQATGIQRVLVDLPRATVRSGTLQKQGGQGVFSLTVNSQYLGEGRDQLVLKYNVHTCRMKLFSACLSAFKPGTDVVVPITQSETSINIPLEFRTKSKVVYTLARKGSRWYNDNYLSTFETDSISQK